MSPTKTPSRPEDEYFARVEAEKKRKLAEEHREALDKAQREKLKKTHWMHCPKCGLVMETLTLREVEIERCFGCGGTYLDDGELEKLSQGSTGLLGGIVGLFRGDE